MNHIPEDPARKANRISSGRHLDFNQLLKEHFADDAKPSEATGRLLALFLFEKPYVIGYEYRKRSSGYKKDKPVLDLLIEQGIISLVEKTSKRIIFEYVGELPEGK